MSKEVQLTLMGTWANVGSLLQAKQGKYASAFHSQVNREQDSNVARASKSVIIPSLLHQQHAMAGSHAPWFGFWRALHRNSC